MTGHIGKTVFISYRRTNLPWALFIYQNLTIHGYDVFFDDQSIGSGNFEKVILDNIRARAHFLLGGGEQDGNQKVIKGKIKQFKSKLAKKKSSRKKL